MVWLRATPARLGYRSKAAGRIVARSAITAMLQRTLAKRSGSEYQHSGEDGSIWPLKLMSAGGGLHRSGTTGFGTCWGLEPREDYSQLPSAYGQKQPVFRSVVMRSYC